MAGTKVRRSPEEWANLLKEYHGTDLPQEEFCRQHGLKLSTLTSQLSKRRGEKSFVGVVAAGTAPTELEAIRIDFPSGLRITVGR